MKQTTKRNPSLPRKIVITKQAFKASGCFDDMEDFIGDFVSEWLSNKYGYCHKGFKFNISIQVSDIKWDTSN